MKPFHNQFMYSSWLISRLSISVWLRAVWFSLHHSESQPIQNQTRNCKSITPGTFAPDPDGLDAAERLQQHEIWGQS